jgi:cell wall-associated NlpC family hydrolase
VAVVRDKYAADKKALDDLIAQQAPQVDALAAKKKDIEAQIAQLQQLRQQAYGSSGGTGVLKPVACPVEYVGGAAGKAIQAACSQIGKPYVFATPASFDRPAPSYDCSGLTGFAWKAAGFTLTHASREQYAATRRISRAELRPGDLAFFYADRHHVAIYAGGGWVVTAPHTGDYVRMKQIDDMGPLNGFGRVA